MINGCLQWLPQALSPIVNKTFIMSSLSLTKVMCNCLTSSDCVDYKICLIYLLVSRNKIILNT